MGDKIVKSKNLRCQPVVFSSPSLLINYPVKDCFEEDNCYDEEQLPDEPCEKYSLGGEIAGTYSKTIQAEKFNYT